MAAKSNPEHTPLAFQLDVPWESASLEAKSQSVEKASKDWLLVCNMTTRMHQKAELSYTKPKPLSVG